jgi:iron complex outermembrane receptor protein
MKKRNFLAVLCATSSVVSLPICTVLAQDSPVSTLSGLEEVIVQARRTDEGAQSVPISVTPLSAEILEERGITNFQDLQYNVSGLSFNESNSRNGTRVQLRGQSEAFGSDFPGVDTLFADVPLQIGGAVPLYDLSSVQVLKGPQGVSFGRNSTGGAILFYPVRPQSGFSAYVDAAFSNFNGRYYEAMVNVPLIEDKLMVRASARLERRDGITKNVITGSDMDTRHSDNWRLSILARPTEWLENYSVFTSFDLDTTAAANYVLAVNPAGTVPSLYRPPLWNGPTFLEEVAAQRALGRDYSRGETDGFTRTKQILFGNTTTVELTDNFRVKNIFGYQRSESLYSFDQDGTSLEIIRARVPVLPGRPTVNQTFSNELQLQGESLDDRWRWLTGIYASRARPDKEGDPTVSVVLYPFSALAARNANSEIDSFAPFAQVMLPLDMLSERLSLTLGARYTWDERSFVNTSIAGRSATNPTGAIITCGPTSCTQTGGTPRFTRGEGKFEGWNWSATLDYKVNDDILTYLAHRHGFKGGSFNPSAVESDLFLVDPEYVDDVELGIKTDWTLGSLKGRTNVAYYYQWYKDIVRTVFNVALAQALNTNVGEATIDGIDLETTVVPLHGLEVSAFYAYTHAILKKAEKPLTVKRFPDVPVHKASLSVRYELPFAERISLGAQATYTSSHYLNQNSQRREGLTPGYTLVNLRADWKQVLGSNIDVSVFVKNVNDKQYWLGGADVWDDLGFIAGILGEPRTYGAQLRYSFGGN